MKQIHIITKYLGIKENEGAQFETTIDEQKKGHHTSYPITDQRYARYRALLEETRTRQEDQLRLFGNALTIRDSVSTPLCKPERILF